MSRKVTEMEEQIFEQLGTFVEDEHKDYIIECERHISIEKSYRESCCDLLARGKISKIFEHTEYAVAFVRYDDHTPESHAGRACHKNAVEKYRNLAESNQLD